MGLPVPLRRDNRPDRRPQYTSLTPVTASAYQIKVDNTGSWPSWVQTLSAGNYLIEGCAFAPGANIFSNVANLTIRGCTIQPTGLAAVNFQGGNLTMAYCRVGAPDQSGANHLHEVIDGDIMTGDLRSTTATSTGGRRQSTPPSRPPTSWTPTSTTRRTSKPTTPSRSPSRRARPRT